MHSNVRAYIRGLAEPIRENIGVKQGDPLGPRLFNRYIHDLPKCMHNESSASGGPLVRLMSTNPVNLNGKTINCLLYADDLVLFSTTAQGLQNQLDNLHRYCQANDLNVNTTKTEWMKIKTPCHRQGTATENMYFNGKAINKVA